MARKLKTYLTSLGFFDLAIAAPSMKAALEAWGSKSNLFHQGMAQETDDPAIVDAAMARPGTVVKRPVGSTGRFRQDAGLPPHLPETASHKPHSKRAAKKGPGSAIDAAAARKAALAFDRQEKKREQQARKEEAARTRERERRDAAIARAQNALENAELRHDERSREIEADRAAVDERAQAEDARWRKEKTKLDAVLRRAREA